jgi:hypothetical protein
MATRDGERCCRGWGSPIELSPRVARAVTTSALLRRGGCRSGVWPHGHAHLLRPAFQNRGAREVHVRRVRRANRAAVGRTHLPAPQVDQKDVHHGGGLLVAAPSPASPYEHHLPFDHLVAGQPTCQIDPGPPGGHRGPTPAKVRSSRPNCWSWPFGGPRRRRVADSIAPHGVIAASIQCCRGWGSLCRSPGSPRAGTSGVPTKFTCRIALAAAMSSSM